ncbi:hypothetical protein CMUS01_16390 [Colletotrichum musicola]|uniref:Heterokaryon incompatibility domain-containing protein n=1 Tax=Colletotrichum musicola TaxID=2175873 RepID=A0A8H6MJH0_9PEZI|nr:hypothetical protein CMUS01_16390 [Colletotrichum musicola]
MDTQNRGSRWSHLCYSCCSIFSEAREISEAQHFFPEKEDGYRLPHTKESLEGGNRDGCRLCSLIWIRRLNFGEKSKIPWPDWDDLHPDDSVELRYGFASGTDGYTAMGLWRWNDKSHNTMQTLFLNVEETTDEFAASIPREQSELAQNTNTGSEQAISLVQKFLADCLASHNCSMPNEDGWAPTRLIDLGESPSSAPRLVSTQSLQRPVRWMTLSHCWGTRQPCILVESNMSQFMDEIPRSDLSRTFSDAFAITKKLGVRYLWIDSICIIQHDEDDWRREAPTMSKVYSMSLCTISASHAADGSGGCFSDRNPWTVLPCVVPSPFSMDPNAPPFLIHGEKLEDRWNRDIPEAPLYQRAWVFQERLLSPRTLFFGKHQILWGCGQHELCESFPRGVPSQADQIWWQFVGDRRRFRHLLLESANDKPFEAEWSQTVQQYSKTQLTFPSDREVAFQGLPNQLLEKRDTKQAYGVWIDESLPWALLWSPLEKVQERPVDYLAPSWSWMTLNTPISFGNWYPHGKGLLKAVGLTTSGLGGTNRLGKAENDGLVLEGILKVAFHKTKTTDESRVRHMISQTPDRVEEMIQLPTFKRAEDLKIVGSMLRSESSGTEWTRPSETEWTDMITLDSAEESPIGDIVICLPVVMHFHRTGVPWRLEGLILEPVPQPLSNSTALSTSQSEGDKLLPVFRRIGSYSLMHRACWVATTSEVRFMLV